jgi:hypothetical protein
MMDGKHKDGLDNVIAGFGRLATALNDAAIPLATFANIAERSRRSYVLLYENTFGHHPNRDSKRLQKKRLKWILGQKGL